MRIACLMMQKNERALLNHWARFHGALFGMENLFVFDNGSDDPHVIELLGSLASAGTKVDFSHSTKADFENKGTIIADKIKELDGLGLHDFYFPLDCDEFLAVQTIDKRILFEREAIENVLAPLVKSPHVLAIKGSFNNAPVSTTRFYFYPARKCFFAAGSIKSLDIGFHKAECKNSTQIVATALIHFHLRHKPYAMVIEAAQEKLAARLPDFRRETLLQYRGSGRHLTTYLLMSEEQYMQSLDQRCNIRIKGFEHRLAALGLMPPFQDGDENPTR